MPSAGLCRVTTISRFGLSRNLFHILEILATITRKWYLIARHNPSLLCLRLRNHK